LKKSLLLIIFIVLSVLTGYFCIQYDKNEKIYSENKKIYSGSEKVNLSNLNDPLFTQNEYSYNHSLAKESLELSVEAYSSNVSELNWGEDKPSGRDDNVKSFLTKRGYGNFTSYNYDVSLNDSSSKVAFSIAEKPFDKNTSVVAVAVRGGNYGLEWADNFNLGDSQNLYHRGFYEASFKVKKQIDEYLKEYVEGKKIKIWLTGYSRGGAVANIVASMYNENKASFPCSIYAYTFASPKTSVISETKAHDTIHKNIFNILSPNDPVYNVPPENWGFGRFGICVVFPDNNNLEYEGAISLSRKVAKSYYSKTGEILITSGNPVTSFLNVFIKSAKGRDFFVKNLSLPIMDFIKIKMLKVKDENGVWQQIDLTEGLRQMHGEESVRIYNDVLNNDFYLSFKKIGFNIPDDLYVFITLCHLNGFNDFEKSILAKINVNDLGEISSVTSGKSIVAGHRNEFYMSWLENTDARHLNFVKE